MLPIFSAAWNKKPEERAKHADTAERLNETLSLFLKKRSQSFICLPDEVLGILVEQDVVHGFRAAIVGFAIALR